jgi:hypothetical protein
MISVSHNFFEVGKSNMGWQSILGKRMMFMGHQKVDLFAQVDLAWTRIDS